MKIRNRALAAGLAITSVALLCAPLAHAANDVVLERAVRTVDVSADGTFSQVGEILIRLVTEQGAKGSGQVPIPYSDSLQSLEVVEAYTLKADGTRIDVPADKIFTQAAPVAVNAPMFNDIKYKIIVFPEPQPGGKLYFRTHIKQKTPHFPNHFSVFEAIPLQIATESYLLRVSAPIGYPLKAESRDVPGGKVADKDGRAQWEWKYSNAEAQVPEPFQLMGAEVNPYIAISSFADWPALAKAYRERAADKVNVTPEIQTLADEITKGITEPRAQTQAIYHWVAQNVRYVAVFLGLGGFVPRDTADILKTKYGDCKDHTVILESLLRAKGIETTPVLINTMPTFKLPGIPVVGAFNHAITYVPKLDMYLDGTASHNRFGTLPNGDAGKPVLLVTNGLLANTPHADAKADTVLNRVDMTLKADGSISGRSEIVSTGAIESILRGQIASVPANQKDKLVTRMLANKGEGTYASSSPTDLAVPFAFSAKYEIKDAVTLDSPGAFPFPRGLIVAGVATSVVTGDLNKPERRTPFKCGSQTSIEEISLQLPDSLKVAALPKDVTHKDKSMSFEARYRQDGQKITATRKLIRDRAREYCDPSMWEEVVRVRDIIARDSRAQVLIQ